MAAATLSDHGWPGEVIERQLAHIDQNRLRAGASSLHDRAETHELLKPSWSSRQGFLPFQLQNNNASIRRIRQRIAILEKAANENVTSEVEGNGYILREDAEENRVMFIFDGKPEPEVRSLLKSWGFRWSPARGAWVRMLNASGRYAAKQVREKLEA